MSNQRCAGRNWPLYNTHGRGRCALLVIGAGIGGLTAALKLHARGIEPLVFESVTEIRPLGVGINLLPHGTRELIELGLGETLAATRHRDARAQIPEPIWSGDHGGSARSGGRLPLAAILDPPRRAADDPAAGGP